MSLNLSLIMRSFCQSGGIRWGGICKENSVYPVSTVVLAVSRMGVGALLDCDISCVWVYAHPLPLDFDRSPESPKTLS